MYRLSLRIDGDITIEAFREALAGFLHLLREVEQSVAGERTVRWTLEGLHHGSPATMIWKGEARPAKQTKKVVVIKPDYAPIVGRALLSGVRRLEHGEGRPADFNDEALDATLALARVTKRQGISALSITGENSGAQPEAPVTLDVTERTAAAVEEIIAPRYTAPGAIEGVLQAITSRGGLYFVIYDSIFSSRVRCDIPAILKTKALDAFDHRVLVSGMVSRDAEGHPRHIKAQNIDPFPDDLPQSIRGLDPDFTGTLSSAEYLKRGWPNG
jgi:hypothetical protein